MASSNLGSDFDDFLAEEGLLECVSALAIKRRIALLLSERMISIGVSKAEVARRMGTSRSSLNRLLDPDNLAVTLQTLQAAACALNAQMRIEFHFRDPVADEANPAFGLRPDREGKPDSSVRHEHSMP